MKATELFTFYDSYIEYLCPNKIKKKRFMFYRKELKDFTHLWMVEELESNQRTLKASLKNSLNYFIEPFFTARYITDSYGMESFPNAALFMLKLSPNLNPDELNKCFEHLNNVIHSFISIKTLEIDGPFITLFSADGLTEPLVLLAARWMALSLRNYVDSILFIENKEFSAIVRDDTEPYTDFVPESLGRYKHMLTTSRNIHTNIPLKGESTGGIHSYSFELLTKLNL